MYVVAKGAYDKADLTNSNTIVLINNNANVLSKLDKINTSSNINLTDDELTYLKALISTGAATLGKVDTEALSNKLNKYICAEDLESIISITPNSNATIKTFHTNEYVRISSHYFHPNDLLIYNDNNWGYYEIHMFGVSSDNVEINKQPRFWFYKKNVLKTQEKETISQIISDVLFTNTYRFVSQERTSLINLVEGGELDDYLFNLSADDCSKLIDKIIMNNDIINQKYKTYLITKLKKEELAEGEDLTSEEVEELKKQIQLSKNTLGVSFGQNEIRELTDEILEELIEDFKILDNHIEQKVEKDQIYYELNNEMILDPADRAIYMNLNRLIGYLRQAKNLEIIFHYKNRRLNSSFLQDTISDWNQNDSESSSYIAHRPIYKTNSGAITWDDPWFYNWLVSLIENKILNAYLKIKDLMDKIDQMEKDIEDLKKQIQNIIDQNQKYYLQRLNSLIVSQPTQPVLTETFFPKLWICNDEKSGYGVIYWRTGGENAEGVFDAKVAVKWMPISTVWTPEPAETPVEPTPDEPETPTTTAKYTQLEYLTTAPGRYIDTGVLPTEKLSMYYTVSASSTYGTGSSDLIYLFGRDYTHRESGNSRATCRFSLAMGKKSINTPITYWGNRKIYDKSIKNFSFLDKHTFEYQPNEWFVIDGDIPLDHNAAINHLLNKVFQAPSVASKKYFDKYTIHLNGFNKDGTNENSGILNIYACQFYEDSKLTYDFVPVIDNETKKVGLYDKVNEKFYGNAGTDGSNFDAGPMTETTFTPKNNSSTGGTDEDIDPSFTGGGGTNK